MKIIVIGGTGLIGSKVVTKLRESGFEAVAVSPNSGVNTITGDGLVEALAGASVVVRRPARRHCSPANGPAMLSERHNA